MKVINKYRYEGRCGDLELRDAGGVSSVLHQKKDVDALLTISDNSTISRFLLES